MWLKLGKFSLSGLKFDEMLKRRLYQKHILYTLNDLIEAFILKSYIEWFQFDNLAKIRQIRQTSLHQSFLI